MADANQPSDEDNQPPDNQFLGPRPLSTPEKLRTTIELQAEHQAEQMKTSHKQQIEQKIEVIKGKIESLEQSAANGRILLMLALRKQQDAWYKKKSATEGRERQEDVVRRIEEWEHKIYEESAANVAELVKENPGVNGWSEERLLEAKAAAVEKAEPQIGSFEQWQAGRIETLKSDYEQARIKAIAMEASFAQAMKGLAEQTIDLDTGFRYLKGLDTPE